MLGALRKAGLGGATAAQAGAAANVREDVAREALDSLVESGRVIRLAKPAAYLDGGLAAEIFERVRAQLEVGERERPWVLGATSLGLSRALAIPEATLVRLLGAFAEDGRIAHRAGYYATPAFTPALSAEQRAFFEELFARQTDGPPIPLVFADFVARIKTSKISGLLQAFDTLLASGALIKVGDDVYAGEQIAQVRAKLEASLRRQGSLTMAQFRDLIGTTRKYAVPLLEWFDASGVTIRNGDLRVLRERTKV